MALTLQQAKDMRRAGETMTVKAAHNYLKAWRARHSGGAPSWLQGTHPAAPQGKGGGAASGDALAGWHLGPLAAPQGQGEQWPTVRPVQRFTREAEDLTLSDFLWPKYIANRTDWMLETIFGEAAIVRFEIRFIRPVDRNTGQHRCDFIAVRSDDLVIRLHPSAGKDAHPVLCSWSDISFSHALDLRGRVGDAASLPMKSPPPGVFPAAPQGSGTGAPQGKAWVGPSPQGPPMPPMHWLGPAMTSALALAAPPPPRAASSAGVGHPPAQAKSVFAAPAAPQGGFEWAGVKERVYHSVAPHDVMTRREAIAWLLDRQRKAEETGWSSPFYADLTDQAEFCWPLLVAGLPGGKDVLQQGVDQFALVWLGRGRQQPAFFCSTPGGQYALLLTEPDPWNTDAVQDILWT